MFLFERRSLEAPVSQLILSFMCNTSGFIYLIGVSREL